MYETKEILIESVLQGLPYPNQMSELDFTGQDHIYFTWRGIRIKADTHGMVMEVKGGMLEGGAISILMDSLFRRAYFELERRKINSSLSAPSEI